MNVDHAEYPPEVLFIQRNKVAKPLKYYSLLFVALPGIFQLLHQVNYSCSYKGQNSKPCTLWKGQFIPSR